MSSVENMKQQLAQRDYWRSLEHLANTPAIQESAAQEFGSYEPDGMITMSPVTRRRFMKLMGASMGLAGLTLSGCRRWPQEKLAPFHSGRSRAIRDDSRIEWRRKPAARDEL